MTYHSATQLFSSAVQTTSPAETSRLQIPSLNMSEVHNQRYMRFIIQDTKSSSATAILQHHMWVTVSLQGKHSHLN